MTHSTLRLRVLLALLAAILAPCAVATTYAQDDEDEPHLLGLIAQYSGSGGEACTRLDDNIAFDWGSGVPDSQIAPGRFRARWNGRLLSQAPGKYQLHVYAQGKFTVRLDGNEVLAGAAEEPQWFHSAEMELAYDQHPLEVTFEKTGERARIGLYWSGPQFQLEPVSPRQLFHERGKSPDLAYERGQLLATALRCTQCHADAKTATALPAPALDRLAGTISPAWIVRSLTAKDGGHSPSFSLTAADAAAIGAYLLQSDNSPPKMEIKKPKSPGPKPAAEPAAKPADKSKKNDKPKVEAPNPKQGERLVLTLGCLACHELGELGESGLFGGGDLTKVADKRPADFFARWLAEPDVLNAQHRMPVFELTPAERESLALFLQTQHGAKSEKLATGAMDSSDKKLVARGQQLAQTYRCGSCHQLPHGAKENALPSIKPLAAGSEWQKSCANLASAKNQQPNYRLAAKDASALQTYFAASQPTANKDGKLLLVQQNCLACHQREGLASVASALPARLPDKLAGVAEAHDELAPLLPAMTPPALNSVGDKLPDAVLKSVIRRQGDVHRPYLLVRMPKFRMSDEETAALVDYLVATDRIPPLPEPATEPSDATQTAAFVLAGGRLVSSDGFSCTACHQVGNVVPDKAPLNARGPSLSRMDERLRKPWFDRWVRNPARIVPRMEMPSVQLPVRGVLGENLHDQLAAVWHVLNTPGFEPPEPNPVRVLRLSGVPERKEQPIVIRDVFKLGDKTWIDPLVIGLPNRQNILIDLETNRLAGWWLGDVARQRTKGKSWHWEPGGTFLPIDLSADAEPILLVEEKQLQPQPIGQNVTDLADYTLTRDGVTFVRRLSFSSPKSTSTPLEVLATESYAVLPSAADSGAGFTRTLEFRPFPVGAELQLRLIDTALAKQSRWNAATRTLALPGIGGRTIQVVEPKNVEWNHNGTLLVAAQLGNDQPIVRLTLLYRSELVADQYLADPLPVFAAEPVEIEVAPGFIANRLPLPDDIMPTGLSWNSRGELVFSTLKGQVILARDTDGDGLDDETQLLAEGLAAPYGLWAGEDGYVDVITKPALVRVHLSGSSEQNLRVQTLASGWGHTEDYHDWAVGLVRDASGAYYIGLPCQQDDRTPAQANLRGQMLKLAPRKPTTDDPRLFAIEPVSAGHRFPMGLALNSDGELFVTDNQGNYNPFNELNHVRQGAHFGFINKLQKNAGMKSPPLDEPAIDIPHPWTRSVNGICFLHTPLELMKAKGSAFGPLEGHLVGCEYDTRRLVRMSLEKVGGQFQGAAYPLSIPPAQPENGLLGPLVCNVSPRGELYVGNIRDSGWGAGNNIGEIVQIKFDPAKLPCGIAEVRAAKQGFTIDFLQPVDPKLAANPASYSVESYRREATPAYGGSDIDRRTEKVLFAHLAPDSRSVSLELAELREGFDYELRLKNLAPSGGTFHPAEAYYTLRRKP